MATLSTHEDIAKLISEGAKASLIATVDARAGQIQVHCFTQDPSGNIQQFPIKKSRLRGLEHVDTDKLAEMTAKLFLKSLNDCGLDYNRTSFQAVTAGLSKLGQVDFNVVLPIALSEKVETDISTTIKVNETVASIAESRIAHAYKGTEGLSKHADRFAKAPVPAEPTLQLTKKHCASIPDNLESFARAGFTGIGQGMA